MNDSNNRTRVRTERAPRTGLATIALCVAAMLGGCMSLAPDYQRPASPVPSHWPTGAAYASPTPSPTSTASAADLKPATALPWREFITDTRLQQVVAQALSDSRSLRKAVASIESARAQYGVQRAAQFPTVSAGIDGARARTLSSSASSSSTGTSTNTSANTSAISQSVSATVGVSAFELDLFGKARSLSDAAFETYLSTAEAERSTRIALIAETANAWLTLAADQSRLDTARQTLASASQSMALTRKRLDAGVASMVDVRSAETVYQQARSDVASYTTAVAQDRNALELLAGGPVADALLPTALPADANAFASVPEGLSSRVLLERPDVLEAEHQLKSANADIGAARAAFFPSVSLTGSGGLASTALSSLFSGGARIWSFAPSISVPIFDGGANQANLQYSKSQREVYLNAYELAVQTAFQEVADALATRGTIAEQLAAQNDLVTAAADSYRLAEARYTRGVDTFLTSLVAQRTLYSAQQTLVTTRLDALQNQVTLYRVLGGGLAG